EYRSCKTWQKPRNQLNKYEESCKIQITASHCASLPSQISWISFVIFSRLAGASMVIGADTTFDSTWDLDDILKASVGQN
ncbi:MAG: hypothetical protein AABX74_03935, partial [Nanoarchaeota archaeon]